MKFHNVRSGVYYARVNSSAPRTLLARLRASARLAVLVLLVFALKLGAAAACVKHDFADMGFGTDGSSHAVAMKASPLDGSNDDSTKTKLGHAGTCNHCSCHHSAAMVPDSHVEFAVVPQELAVRTSGLPPSASARLDLRPPIA